MSRRVLHVPALLVVLLFAVLAPAGDAHAHTGLDTSTPADGAVVDGPLTEVVLDFTGTPTVLEDGIAVADATGAQYVPVDVGQDGLRITAQFDPPLSEGSYTLAWRVRSDDTHTIDGSFSFGVVVATPTGPSTSPATTSPVASEPAATDPATTVPATTGQPDTGTSTPEAGTVPGSTESSADETAVALAPPPPPPAGFDGVDDGESTARLGRVVLFPSAVVAVGALAFALWAYAGRATDLGTLLRLVRWLGVGVALGAVIELVGLESSFGGFDEVLGETAGWAALARVVGGVLLVTGLGAVVAGGRSTATSPGSLSAAVRADSIAAPVADRDRAAAGERWRPGPRDAPGLVGAMIVVVSFAFDGHTLSEGPRLLHALASIAHVGAASVWAGGLAAFAVVLWRRHRDGVAADALRMTLRFSVAAMVSLAVAGTAGVAMALLIDSDVAGYLSTDWGRLLLAKLALVAVAAAIGAYNHFRVLPALDARPTDADVLARTRGTVTAEAALLVGAAVVSGLLVAASTL